MSIVGTLWSSVASVRSGRRTARPVGAQTVERLRTGHLVDEVQVDVEQVRLALGVPDHVVLPDLLGQRASHRVLQAWRRLTSQYVRRKYHYVDDT